MRDRLTHIVEMLATAGIGFDVSPDGLEYSYRVPVLRGKVHIHLDPDELRGLTDDEVLELELWIKEGQR